MQVHKLPKQPHITKPAHTHPHITKPTHTHSYILQNKLKQPQHKIHTN